MCYLFKKFSKFYSLTRFIEPKELVFSMWLQICLLKKYFIHIHATQILVHQRT